MSDISQRKFIYSQRRDLPALTPRMMAVLLTLRAADEADSPFILLPGIHKRTLEALFERDWIFASPGLDGTRYKITGRGLKALKVYEPVIKRHDGLCPDCGERPKHITRNGRVEGYCKICLGKSSRRKYRLHIGKNPNALCPRCKKRTRARLPGGNVTTYCAKCNKVLKRRAKRKQIKTRLQRVLAGEFIKCRLEGCEQPVHHTEKSAYDMCESHWREYMTAYNDRRRPNSRAAKARTS